MLYWRILSGIGAGIAAATILPIAGPAMVLTAAGLALGGAGGAAVGALVSSGDKKKSNAPREEGRRKGKQEEKVRVSAKEKMMITCVKEAEKRLKDGKDYFNLLLAMTAMGLATANADGEVCDAEIDEINEFVAGIGHEQLPAHVKGQITRLCNNPPTFNTAMHFVEKVDQKSWPLFAEVIKVVSNADGRVDKREEALLKAWQRCANDKSN